MSKRLIRDCGEILGDLHDLQPFLFIASQGAFSRMKKGKVPDPPKGIFVVSGIAGKGLYPRTGVILPVSRCRNEKFRETLLKLHDFLAATPNADGAPIRRIEAQQLLDKTFGGAVVLTQQASLNGMIEFEQTRTFFSMLSQWCDYVEEVDDDPQGIAMPLSFQPFRWPSYGEFMEWFHGRAPSSSWGWPHCYPALVFGRTGVIGETSLSRKQINRVEIDLGRFFVISPTVQDQCVGVRLKMEGYGWAYLNLTVGQKEVRISLSDTWPPFEIMLEWVKMVARGDVPAQFQIDEEGSDKRLCAFSTDDPARIFFRVVDPYDNEKAFVEGVVNRAQLVKVFKEEFLRFFWNEFKPKHWHENKEKGVAGLKQRVLADPWFSG